MCASVDTAEQRQPDSPSRDSIPIKKRSPTSTTSRHPNIHAHYVNSQKLLMEEQKQHMGHNRPASDNSSHMHTCEGLSWKLLSGSKWGIRDSRHVMHLSSDRCPRHTRYTIRQTIADTHQRLPPRTIYLVSNAKWAPHLFWRWINVTMPQPISSTADPKHVQEFQDVINKAHGQHTWTDQVESRLPHH